MGVYRRRLCELKLERSSACVRKVKINYRRRVVRACVKLINYCPSRARAYAKLINYCRVDMRTCVNLLIILLAPRLRNLIHTRATDHGPRAAGHGPRATGRGSPPPPVCASVRKCVDVAGDAECKRVFLLLIIATARACVRTYFYY